jgi:PAS domain-containing protein
MNHSFKGRMNIALAGALAIGLVTAVSTLVKYKRHQDYSVRLLSGQEKTVILGQLIEARVKAAQEMLPLSVSNQSANESFIERIKSVDSDLKTLTAEKDDQNLQEAVKAIAPISRASKPEGLEDIFVHYRNVKAVAFNLYRLCWANKWMNAARAIGQVVQDLDGLAYHDAQQGLNTVSAKIVTLTGYISRADIPGDGKVQVMGQLAQIKNTIERYTDAVSQAERAKDVREAALKKALLNLKLYNEAQSKGASQFAAKTQEDFVKSVLWIAIAAMAALGWYIFWTRLNSKSFKATAESLVNQCMQWVQSGGGMSLTGVKFPVNGDAEWKPIFQSLDQVHSKLSSLRREDQAIKRLMHQTFILVNRARQAVYWNSSAAAFLKSRTVDESGPVHYMTLLRFPVKDGKLMTDPVEKSFQEKTEVARGTDVVSGPDIVPTRILCTPVPDADGQAEYILVQIRDLRDEFKLIDNEINRQLASVKAAVAALKGGVIPADSPSEARPAIKDTVDVMKAIAIDHQENREMVTGQLAAALERLTREGGLKKNVHGRLHQITEDVESSHKTIKRIEGELDAMSSFLRDSASRDQSIKSEYSVLRRRGSDLQRNIRQEQELATKALSSLQQIDSLTKGIRSREQLIYSALEKATVANANNSILRARPDISIVEITGILDSVNTLAEQFDRAYRFIQQAVQELENQYSSLKTGLEESLATSKKLSEDDRGIIDTLGCLERLTDAAKDDFRSIYNRGAAVREGLTVLESNLGAVEEKCKVLEKVGTASLELQEHMERGFRGILEGTA